MGQIRITLDDEPEYVQATAQPPLSSLSEYRLWELWFQPDCDGCHEIPNAPLPTCCPDCGTDRSADSALWHEIERRGVDWRSVRMMERGG